MDGGDLDSGAAWFATTRWTVVLNAREAESLEYESAIDQFCRSYWPPAYSFIRRTGKSPAEAQDLTQDFFASLIHKNQLKYLQDRRAKFRSFLLTLLKHFLADEHDKVSALKRGGGRTFVSLSEFAEEERLRVETTDAPSPDREFDRRWARALLEQTYRRLEDEYQRKGNAELFQVLKDVQSGSRENGPYAEIGEKLGMSEAAVKSAMHRLRLRHRDILRAEIAATVSSAGEVQEEIRVLIGVLENR